MPTRTTAGDRRVIAIDAAFLDHALWIGAVVALATAVVLLNGLLLLVVVGGCAAAYAVKLHGDNEIARDFDAPLTQTWRAAIWAMGENGLSYGDGTRCGATEAVVRGRDAVIRVEKHPHSVTRVRVRVGVLPFAGNRRRAALLLESVVKNLGAEDGNAAA